MADNATGNDSVVTPDVEVTATAPSADAHAQRPNLSKTVSAIVERWNPRPLTTDQIDLIARQLDELCRDVTG